MMSLSVVSCFFLYISLSFSLVEGDCYDDPPNNKSYDNYNCCYQTLANALINNGDKYQLGRSFFQDNQAAPIQVEVTSK